MGTCSVPGLVCVYDRFQNRYGFMMYFRTGIGSSWIPELVWIYDPLQDRCRFIISFGTGVGSVPGSETGMGSVSVPGSV